MLRQFLKNKQHEKYQQIHKGGQSIIRKVGDHFVIKVYKNSEGKRDDEATNEFKRLVKCRHANILPAYSITTDEEGRQILLLKFASNGNLEQYYKKKGVSTEEVTIENDQKKMIPKGLTWTQRLFLVR